MKIDREVWWIFNYLANVLLVAKARVSKETLSNYPTGKHGYFEPMRDLKEALAKWVT